MTIKVGLKDQVHSEMTLISNDLNGLYSPAGRHYLKQFIFNFDHILINYKKDFYNASLTHLCFS